MVKFSSKHAARSLRCPRLDSWRRHQPPAEDSLGFLGDEMVMAVCVCTPFASHVSIRAVCRRLNELITSEEFRAHRWVPYLGAKHARELANSSNIRSVTEEPNTF